MTSRASIDVLVADLQLRAPAGLRLGHRMIGEDDARHLLPAEYASIRTRCPANLRRSGAARAIAHEFLREMGAPDVSVPRNRHGAPIWAAGFVGSLAHDDTFALAAAAKIQDLSSIGIDIEPAIPLPDELHEIVVTPDDVLASSEGATASRTLFSAKEAVFKAVYPLDGEILGFEHIAVDLARGMASTPGRTDIRVLTQIGSHVLALAYVP
jgi:4'-phosphopantetheinyl transferase EntD